MTRQDGVVEAGGSDDDGLARSAEQRDDEADSREVDADQRERQIDARERVLDRWEREIAARAAALNLLDEVEEEDRERSRLRRVRERERRRDDAEVRRDAAIERDIRRARGAERADGAQSWSASGDVDAPPASAQLAASLQTDPPLEQVLELILAAGVDAVPECAAGSVALISHERLQNAVSTASWAADLDAAQLELDGGPLPSAADGGMVVTTDLTDDERWPQLAALPAARAARGVVSVGLIVGGIGTGVLTLYAEVGGQFGQQALRIGDLLAAHAAASLGRTLDRLTYEAQAEAWQHALASRDAIGQAKGILMEQRSLAADEAFRLLRDTSQRRNVKVRVIAEQVVAERRLPDE